LTRLVPRIVPADGEDAGQRVQIERGGERRGTEQVSRNNRAILDAATGQAARPPSSDKLSDREWGRMFVTASGLSLFTFIFLTPAGWRFGTRRPSHRRSLRRQNGGREFPDTLAHRCGLYHPESVPVDL
jgi:hypothetical protein